jgi:hypothetical protein
VPFLRNRAHSVLEHAVDAVLDGDFLVARFNVNVAGPSFKRVKDGGIDKLDDGGNIRFFRSSLSLAPALSGKCMATETIKFHDPTQEQTQAEALARRYRCEFMLLKPPVLFFCPLRLLFPRAFCIWAAASICGL